MKQLIVVLVPICFLIPSCKAQTVTGETIQFRCEALASKGASDSFSAAYCAGFVDGAKGAIETVDAFQKDEGRSFRYHYCLPNSSTNSEILRSF